VVGKSGDPMLSPRKGAAPIPRLSITVVESPAMNEAQIKNSKLEKQQPRRKILGHRDCALGGSTRQSPRGKKPVSLTQILLWGLNLKRKEDWKGGHPKGPRVPRGRTQETR